MPLSVLQERLSSFPEEYFDEINAFFDLLSYKVAAQSAQKKAEKPKRYFGCEKGTLHYPDDIDFCNDEIAEMFGVNE